MIINYYGHSCFSLNIDGTRILLDPFISGNPKAVSVDVDALSPDYILLSHGHQDHVLDVEKIYAQSKCQVISTFEVVNWFAVKGVENVLPMNHGGKAVFNFGTVKMVNAVHSSSMPDGSYGGNPVGFLIEASGKRIYYAGDTALTLDMKLIGETGKVDFAFFPIGDNFTMGIEDAVKGAEFVNTKKVIGMHYDTFPVIEIDKDYAVEYFQKNGLDLTLMTIGESIEL